MRVGLDGGKAEVAAGEEGDLLVDRERDLEREGGKIGRGGAEQAADGVEARGFERVRALLERRAGGKGAGGGGERGLVTPERGEPRLGAAEGGERAGPAGSTA